MSNETEITFTQTVQYETGGPGKGPIYNAGESHCFREDIAERWIRRNVAFRGRGAAPEGPKMGAAEARPVEDIDKQADLSAAQIAALDHDHDGRAGGSLKGEQSTVARGRRRKVS